jgi:anthranilate phosphoribosyltransferase
VVEFGEQGEVVKSKRSPAFFSIRPCTLTDLEGGDAATNARIMTEVLNGKERGPKRDAVLMNAAAALVVAGAAPDLLAGWKQAAEIVDDGRAAAKLNELIEAGKEFRANKRT